MKTLNPLSVAILSGMASLLVAAAPAQAASISYFLDQSNALPDGSNYLRVDVADGANGAIDFTVQVLGPLSSIAGSNFGIQSFAFNVVPGGSAEAMNITGLPTGWRANDSRRMDGFGLFDVRLAGRGNARMGTLTFSITGIDGDRPEDYALLSRGRAPEGHEFFAAHVAGFQYCREDDGGSCGDKVQPQFAMQSAGTGGLPAWGQDWRHHMDEHWDGRWAEDCITSGFFAGSTAVPLPGTAWLFMAGIAGVLARVRRRAAH